MNSVLKLENITKVFPGVKALNRVHFDLAEGEIHALMGENGAGKSTFIKVITGVNIPEEGEIFLNGEKIVFTKPLDATKKGIAAIYQHVTSYPELTVTENIFIGHEVTGKGGKLNWKYMHNRTKELLLLVGSDIEPTTEMGSLSVAQQQMVEIAKALSLDANIIIMDEPTAALTVRETAELYNICRKLKENKKSIIFISHRLEDIYELADRTTVFRDGNYIGTWETTSLDKNVLIEAMVGREIVSLFPEKTAAIGEEVLRVENFSRVGYFKDVSFSLRKGEILALTGLVGSGRTELAEAIYAVADHYEGKLFIEGKEATIKNPSDAVKKGIGYLPEDRQKQGLVLKMSIGDNIVLSELSKYTNFIGQIDKNKALEEANKLALLLTVKANDAFELTESLSGGNQQKVVIAKMLNSDLKVLIMDEPTKGIDVAAKSAIYGIMNDLAAKGYGIIMISSEMEEVLGMADTVVVMHNGRVTGQFNSRPFSSQTLLRAFMSIGEEEQKS